MAAKSKLSPTDIKFLSDFRKTDNYFLCDKCVNLRKNIQLNLYYYQGYKTVVYSQNIQDKEKFIHGFDKLLPYLNQLYLENK